jgi:hypothetical protein
LDLALTGAGQAVEYLPAFYFFSPLAMRWYIDQRQLSMPPVDASGSARCLAFKALDMA